MPRAPQNLDQFESLVQIVADLRGPDGCPWDKEQTHATLTRFAIEEAHELAEAIDRKDDAAICEELGDVLLQVVLNAQVAQDRGAFAVRDVIRSIAEKMVRRHPHVFGGVKVKDSAQVLKNWENFKAQEKSAPQSAFSLVNGLPALIQAHKIGEKSGRIHFDWLDSDSVWGQVREEWDELKNEMDSTKQDKDRIESEIGDLLFSLAQLARHLGLDPEQALRKTNSRVVKRIDLARKIVSGNGEDWNTITQAEREAAWEEAKRRLENDDV